VELAGEQAVDLLCRHAPREETTATRWCIARALRLVSNSESLGQRIQVMLSAQERIVREVAVEICGWQPPGFMGDTLEIVAREDFYDIVSQKAVEALQRQEEQRWVERLMQEFQSGLTSRRWSLLTSILQLGDPYLLAEPRNRLWIGRILDGAPKEYWEFANEAIAKRKQTVLESAKRIDQRRR
jgi:hypothetical protein